MMNDRATLIVVLASLFMAACNDHEMPEPKIDPSSIYFDYLMWGDEESGVVTVKLQYRAGGPNETAILLKEPARVEFDGEVLLADSARFNGPYYEVIRPAKEFEGLHHIVFTNDKGNKYTTEFDFSVISLKTEIPPIISRNNLVLEIGGLEAGDKLRVLLTDTAFYGRGIEKIDTAIKGHIQIANNELSDLKNGPVHLEILREVEKIPGNTMQSGGRFYLTYGLKREFVLQDSAK